MSCASFGCSIFHPGAESQRAQMSWRLLVKRQVRATNSTQYTRSGFPIKSVRENEREKERPTAPESWQANKRLEQQVANCVPKDWPQIFQLILPLMMMMRGEGCLFRACRHHRPSSGPRSEAKSQDLGLKMEENASECPYLISRIFASSCFHRETRSLDVNA